jgi:hypothetical protein
MQFSNTNKEMHRLVLSIGLVTMTLVFMAGVFGLVSLQQSSTDNIIKARAAEPTAGSTTTWKKIGGLPNSYEVKDIKDFNGNMYMLTAGYKCDDCGLFKLNESSMSFDKIAPNPGNESKDLAISTTGEFYTFGGNGVVLKYNPNGQKWDKLFSTKINGSYPAGITINGSNRHAHAGYSLTLGPDNQFYATALFGNDNQHYVIKYNQSTRVWDKTGPAIPVYQGLTKTGQPGSHGVFDPRIVFGADGTIFMGNTQQTSVAQCDASPRKELVNGQLVDTQPTNILMRLKNNQWETLSTKDRGYVASGYTCGWGGTSIQQSKEGQIYASGGSGQFYTWNTETEKWNLLEQNGYPSNQRRVSRDDVITSAPKRGGTIKVFNSSFSYTVPTKIENQTCDLFIMRNLMSLSDRALVGSIYNKGNENCGNGFPSPSTVNGGAKDIYKTQADINSALSKDPATQFDRGLYYLALDSGQKKSSNLAVQSASYLFSNPNSNENPSSIALQDNGSVLIAANIDNNTSIPGGTTQINLLGATVNSKGKLIKLASDGTQVTSVINLGNIIDQVDVTPDNKIVAIGDFGLVVLNPEGTQIIWSKTLSTWRKERRISISSDGKIASLDFKTVQVWNTDGTQVGADIVLTDSYVEDIALDGQKGMVYIGGFNNTRYNSIPVQIAYISHFNFNTGIKTNKTWGYDPNDLANDLADTRIYRLALSPDNTKLYASAESAGGNTIFRWNGKDLSTRSGVNSGPGGFEDLWMAKSSSHLGYIASINLDTGAVIAGSFNNSVLRNSQRLNTTKVRGDLAVDSQGYVYLTGTSAAHIPSKVAWSIAGQKVDGGLETGYAGADPYILVLKPELNQRVIWTTFGKESHAGEMRSVAVRGNRAAILSSLFKGKAITTQNALQNEPGEPVLSTSPTNRDIFFSVWNTDSAL